LRVGIDDGLLVGEMLGSNEGKLVGISDGATLENVLGCELGTALGWTDGFCEGTKEGN
jgi:hypothetical protein